MSNMLSQLLELQFKVNVYKKFLSSERETRYSLVEPFFKILGFDVSCPFDVIVEYKCRKGAKELGRVDYALMKDDKPLMIVEVKNCQTILNDKHVNQLAKYFECDDVNIAILTDGLEYWFFTRKKYFKVKTLVSVDS